jgi:hypothetical protein
VRPDEEKPYPQQGLNLLSGLDIPKEPYRRHGHTVRDCGVVEKAPNWESALLGSSHRCPSMEN